MSIKTADVGAAQVEDPKKLCQHFCKYFRCKFGDACTYIHPQRIKDMLAEGIIKPVERPPKKDRGICKFFAAGKKCKYGDICIMFKHQKAEANTAEATPTNEAAVVNAESFHFDVAMMEVVETATEVSVKVTNEAAAMYQPKDFVFNPADLNAEETAAETKAKTEPDNTKEAAVVIEAIATPENSSTEAAAAIENNAEST